MYVPLCRNIYLLNRGSLDNMRISILRSCKKFRKYLSYICDFRVNSSTTVIFVANFGLKHEIALVKELEQKSHKPNRRSEGIS